MQPSVSAPAIAAACPSPHVTGVEWGYGAMGNAKWKGVRLKDVLARAGVKRETIEIGLNGADKGVVDATPDFIKSIPAWKAMDENTLVATHMNGEPLPHWNGYPARIVVPGWTATYWVKMVTEIIALTKPQERLLDGRRLPHSAGQVPTGRSIHHPGVRQEHSDYGDGGELAHHKPPGRRPTARREACRDPRHSMGRWLRHRRGQRLRRWRKDLADRGSWRRSRALCMAAVVLQLHASCQGRISIMARATNVQGTSQVSKLIFNPPGYHNNVVQTITVQCV